MSAGPSDAARHRSARQWARLFELPLDTVPALATLSALAAFASMVLNHLVLPSLGSGVHTPHYARIAAASRFSANLAVTAGLITLVSCVGWAVLGHPKMPLRRQLVVFVCGGVVFHVAGLALLTDPITTAREQVYFAVAGANLIGMAVGSAALSRARGAFLRAFAAALTALAALNTVVVVLEFLPDAQLDPWAQSALKISRASGELVYLLVLTASFPLLVPRGVRLRALLARSVGFAVLVLSLYAQRTAQHALQSDYGLVVYSAQRVSLLLDRWPLAYALPFCLVLSATTTGLLSGGSARLQAASGTLLLFAAGYATRAPGRLLSLTIGFMLLARALVAFTEQAPFRSMAPPPPRQSLPPRAADSTREPSLRPKAADAAREP